MKFDFKKITRREQEKLLKDCLDLLTSGEKDKIFRAVSSIKWFGNEKRLLAPLVALTENQNNEIVLLGFEGLSSLYFSGLDEFLIDFVKRKGVKSFENKAEQLAARAVSLLGKFNNETCTGFLSEILVDEKGVFSDELREFAVESLTEIAIAGNENAVRIIEDAMKCDALKNLTQICECALKEIYSADWENKGYFTIQGHLLDSDTNEIHGN
jgi:hypothetical protein